MISEFFATSLIEQERPLRTVPLQVPTQIDPATLPSLIDTIEKVLFIYAKSGEGSALLARTDRLAELVTGLLRPNMELLEDRVQRMRTLVQVFAEGDWLTSEELNALQPTPPANKSHPASDWKRRGRIYSVNHAGREYFARYQFDGQYQPLPIMRDVLAALGEVADAWVLAAWFHYPNGWLIGDDGGLLAPKDALDRSDDLLRAAKNRRGSYVA